MKKTLIIFPIVAVLALSANGTTLLNEPFSYGDGSLTATSGSLWNAHSGAGSVPVTVSSGSISVVQGSGSREDVNRNTGSTMGAGDTWYAGFDVSVAGGNTTVYFAHFLETSTVFGSRVFVTNTVAPSGEFAFGIGNGSTPSSAWTSALDYGTTYRLVVSYAFDTGEGKLWVNPTQETDASISTTGIAGDVMVAFGFRQSSGNSVQTVDNLKVATTFAEVVPEPSVLALSLLGGLALMAARRRS